ncbi:hypothetical protein HKCCE3408_03080 [Rhodobacterales bacterium HKCCE3408]|nr:hypothetical protein [Rhodobacterales bacterium HKCCE3408]
MTDPKFSAHGFLENRLKPAFRAGLLTSVTVAAGFVNGIPQPAAAQGAATFPIPEGCTGFLTVQSRGCTVSHYWSCAADPEGTFWRVTIDDQGPFYLSYTDEEFRWLMTYELRNGIESELVTPEEDPASLSTLLDEGTDSMVFTMRRTGPGIDVLREYTGYDSLTGDEIEIDGERLLITTFAYEYDTDAGRRETTGQQFVSAERGLFFGGLETTTTADGETFMGDYSPREFIDPGDPGFLTMTPLYDCGSTMSALPFPPEDAG